MFSLSIYFLVLPVVFGCLLACSYSCRISDKSDSFCVCFTGKNYSAWAFRVQLFVKGKDICDHVNRSDSAPQNKEKEKEKMAA